MNGFSASHREKVLWSCFEDETGHLFPPAGWFGGKLASITLTFIYTCWSLFFITISKLASFSRGSSAGDFVFRWHGESHSSRHTDVTTHLCKNRTNASLPHPLPFLSFSLFPAGGRLVCCLIYFFCSPKTFCTSLALYLGFFSSPQPIPLPSVTVYASVWFCKRPDILMWLPLEITQEPDHT